MRWFEKHVHEGMMTATGRWSDGEIGVFRFAVSFYSRFLLGLLFSFTLGWIGVIIEQRRDKLAQIQNDERTPHGRNNEEEVGSSKAVYAH
jgi:hypothetical protein